jgi:hypothetical protein
MLLSGILSQRITSTQADRNVCALYAVFMFVLALLFLGNPKLLATYGILNLVNLLNAIRLHRQIGQSKKVT